MRVIVSPYTGYEYTNRSRAMPAPQEPERMSEGVDEEDELLMTFSPPL